MAPDSRISNIFLCRAIGDRDLCLLSIHLVSGEVAPSYHAVKVGLQVRCEGRRWEPAISFLGVV